MRNRKKAEMHKLMEERARLSRQIEALQNELKGLDRAIGVLGSNQADVPAPKPIRERARNVKETVLSLVTEAGGTGASVNEVLERALTRGVRLERGTVSSLLSRFKSEGALEMRDGRYVLASRASGAKAESVFA